MGFPDDLGKFPASIPSCRLRARVAWDRDADGVYQSRAPSLRRRLRRARMRRNEVIDRGLRAAFAVLDAGERQRHYGDRERPHEHALVHIAEMTDAEILAGIAAAARA